MVSSRIRACCPVLILKRLSEELLRVSIIWSQLLRIYHPFHLSGFKEKEVFHGHPHPLSSTPSRNWSQMASLLRLAPKFPANPSGTAGLRQPLRWSLLDLQVPGSCFWSLGFQTMLLQAGGGSDPSEEGYFALQNHGGCVECTHNIHPPRLCICFIWQSMPSSVAIWNKNSKQTKKHGNSTSVSVPSHSMFYK